MKRPPSVTALIPLYAIGVFLSFTLSQAGMARRWWKGGHGLPPGEQPPDDEPGWQGRLVLNGLGALVTGGVTLIFAVTKFAEGAWIVLAEKLMRKWDLWGDGVRLVILDSPYRVMLEPLLAYIEQIAAQRQPNETITIVVPQIVPRHWFDNLLHTQTVMLLRLALLLKPDIVVTGVPYQVP